MGVQSMSGPCLALRTDASIPNQVCGCFQHDVNFTKPGVEIREQKPLRLSMSESGSAKVLKRNLSRYPSLLIQCRSSLLLLLSRLTLHFLPRKACSGSCGTHFRRLF
jgi:hypothetical protein